MTSELLTYQSNYAQWAQDRAPIRLDQMRKASDEDALRLWRAGKDEMRAAMWALMDAELQNRIRRLADANPAA